MSSGNLCVEPIFLSPCFLYDLRSDSDISVGRTKGTRMIFQTGDVLRKWRGDRWTVEELAERAGLDKNTISRAERNQPTRTDTLEQIVTALGHTMKELHEALGHASPADAAWLAQLHALSDESRERVSGLTRQLSQLEEALRAASDVRGGSGAAPDPARRSGSARIVRKRKPGNGDPARRRRREDDADRS